MDNIHKIQIKEAVTVNLQEAIRSGMPFTSTEVHEVIQHFTRGTGPFSDLVECDYFVVDGEFELILGLDAEDILGSYKLL